MVYERHGLAGVMGNRDRTNVTVDDMPSHIEMSVGRYETVFLTAEQARYLASQLNAAANRMEKRKQNASADPKAT